MTSSESTQSPMKPGVQSDEVADVGNTSVELVPVSLAKLGRYTTTDKPVPHYRSCLLPLLFCDPRYKHEAPDDNRNLPPGWEKHVHLEGSVYYWNSEHQVITFSNILDADVLHILHGGLKKVHDRMISELSEESILHFLSTQRKDVVPSMNSWHLGLPEWELCLEVVKDEAKCNYYIADWKRCCVFYLEGSPWADEDQKAHTPNPLYVDMLGLDSHACYEQLELTMQAEFWRHVEYFPEHRNPLSEKLGELKIILQHAMLDRMTSLQSTVSWSLQSLDTSLRLFPEGNDNPLNRGYINIFIGRHLSHIYEERSFNLFGTPYARMDRTQSRYYQPQPQLPKTRLGRLITLVFLFDEPLSFYRKLCETWVDRTVFIDQWRSLLKDVQKEWKSTGFMATVILAVNMGFLTINQLGTHKDDADLPLAAQVLSVTSALFSLGSIVSGMILRHRHRALDTDYCTAEDANKYMHAYAKRARGLYTAAVLFSLPFGMLLWSLILFVAGMLYFSLKRFSHTASPFVGTTLALAVFVAIFQIWYFRGLEPVRKGSTWVAPPVPVEEDLESSGGTLTQSEQVDALAGDDPLAAAVTATPPTQLTRIQTFAAKTKRRMSSFWSMTTAVESPRAGAGAGPDLEAGSPASPDRWSPKKRGSWRSFRMKTRDAQETSLAELSPRTPIRAGWSPRTEGILQQDAIPMVESPTSIEEESTGRPWAPSPSRPSPSVIQPATGRRPRVMVAA